MERRLRLELTLASGLFPYRARCEILTPMVLDAANFRHIDSISVIDGATVEAHDAVGRVYRLTVMKHPTIGQLVHFDVLVADEPSLHVRPFPEGSRTWTWHRVDRPIPFPASDVPTDCLKQALEILDLDLDR